MTRRADLYDGRDPADVPAYGPAEAARLVDVPLSTLRSWVFGRLLVAADGAAKRTAPVIAPPNQRFLSFTNVVEAHVLASLRRKHAIELKKIRSAVAYVKRELGVDHPLARERFKTDGVDLFVDRLGGLINASREGQVAMRAVLEDYLERVEYGRDRAIRFFPLHRPGAPALIVVDPRRAFGRPVIDGTSVPIEDVRSRFDQGDPVDALAKDYHVSRAAIEEALRATPKAA